MPFRKILLQQSDSFFIQTFIGCLIWFPVFACPRMVLLILGYNNVQTGSSTLITNSYSAYPENLKCKSSDYQGLSHTEPKTSQWLPDLCGEMFIAWLPWLAFARWNVIKKKPLCDRFVHKQLAALAGSFHGRCPLVYPNTCQLLLLWRLTPSLSGFHCTFTSFTSLSE